METTFADKGAVLAQLLQKKLGGGDAGAPAAPGKGAGGKAAALLAQKNSEENDESSDGAGEGAGASKVLPISDYVKMKNFTMTPDELLKILDKKNKWDGTDGKFKYSITNDRTYPVLRVFKDNLTSDQISKLSECITTAVTAFGRDRVHKFMKRKSVQGVPVTQAVAKLLSALHMRASE